MKLALPSRIHELRAIIDRVARTRGVALVPEIELDSLDAVKGLPLESPPDRGAILPFRSVRDEVEAGTSSAAAFDDSEMCRRIALVTAIQPRNPEVAALVAVWVVDRAQALDASERKLMPRAASGADAIANREAHSP